VEFWNWWHFSIAINHHLSFSTCAARRKFAQKLKTRKLQNLQNSTKERKIEFKCFAFKFMSSKRSKFSFMLLSKKLQQFVKFKNQSSDNKTSNNKSIDARQWMDNCSNDSTVKLIWISLVGCLFNYDTTSTSTSIVTKTHRRRND
jgi:hypothetical protein